MALRALTITSLVLGLGGVAFGQECNCPGKPLHNPYSGGDGKPLHWSYGASLVHGNASAPPAIICYRKVVANREKQEIANIRWEIAGFYRRFLPATSTVSSCPQIPGEMRPSPESGPLFHGVSSSHYETTVRGPKDGWKQADASDGRITVGRPSEWLRSGGPSGGSLPIGSIISFATESGRPDLVAMLDISSQIVPTEAVVLMAKQHQTRSRHVISYVMKYRGPGTVVVRMNMRIGAFTWGGPWVSGFNDGRYVSGNAENLALSSIRLSADQPQLFTTATDAPVLETATVVVYGPRENILAIDTIGVYVDGNGGAAKSSMEYWNQTR